MADLWLSVSCRDSTGVKLPPECAVGWWKALREHLKCQLSGLWILFLPLPKQSSEISTSDRDGGSWGSWLWEPGLPGEPSWEFICMVRLLCNKPNNWDGTRQAGILWKFVENKVPLWNLPGSVFLYFSVKNPSLGNFLTGFVWGL